MTITGPLILAFIIYHILHLTTGTVHSGFEEGKVYHNLTTGLGGVVGLIYIVAMIMLAFHLWHGVWSMFQTLGLPEDRYTLAGPAVRDDLHTPGDAGVHRRPPGGHDRVHPQVTRSVPWNSSRTSPLARSTRSGPGTSST